MKRKTVFSYDMKTRERTERTPGGLANRISFQRLVGVLIETGEVKSNEIVTFLSIDEGGITYHLTTTAKPVKR